MKAAIFQHVGILFVECSTYLKSIDKQLLGQVAAVIRSYRAPEPYKGKGLEYEGVVIIKKASKKK